MNESDYVALELLTDLSNLDTEEEDQITVSLVSAENRINILSGGSAIINQNQSICFVLGAQNVYMNMILKRH